MRKRRPRAPFCLASMQGDSAATRVAVLGEKMKDTKQQEYKTDIEKLARITESAEERMNASLERLITDIAKRDIYMVRIIYAAIGLDLALLGFLIVLHLQFE